MARHGYAVYKETQVNTASGANLVLLLYDAAITHLTQAAKAIELKVLNEAHQRLINVQDILTELMGALNMEMEIAQSLYALYEYAFQRLVTANVNKEVEPVKEVLGYLTDLRDTWRQAMATARSPAAGTNGALSGSGGGISAEGGAGSGLSLGVDITS